MPPPVCLLDVGADKFVHVTTVLRDVLHWLPMPQRIQFKVAQLLLNFDCVRGSGPAYFRDVRIPVAGISSRSNFRSVQRGDMVVQRTRTRAARLLSFHVAAPVVWHAIPVNSVYLRSTSISQGQFRAGLKTRLFNQAYDILENIFVLRVYYTY